MWSRSFVFDILHDIESCQLQLQYFAFAQIVNEKTLLPEKTLLLYSVWHVNANGARNVYLNI